MANGEFRRNEKSLCDFKYLESYIDGEDPVHFTRGTCNLSELVECKLIHEVMYKM